MSLYEDLTKQLKTKARDGESYEDFAKRASNLINKLPDPDWKKLTADVQSWGNAVLQAREDKKELPPLGGFPGAEEEPDHDPETGEVTDEEADAEAPADDGDTTDADADDDEDDEGDEEDPASDAPEEGQESVDQAEDSEQEAATDETTPAPKAGAKKKSAAKKAAGAKKPAKEKDMKTAKGGATSARKKVASGGSRTRITDTDTIKLLSKKNPYREGSLGYKAFEKYKDGMTVKAFAKSIGTLDTSRDAAALLRFDQKKGYVKVVAGKSAA